MLFAMRRTLMMARKDTRGGGGGGSADDALPPGFDGVELSATTVDWEDTKQVAGVVVGFDSLKVDGEDKRTMLIRHGKEVLRVWDSPGLRGLFGQVHVGDEVIIRLAGWKELEGGRKMRQFTAGVKRGKGSTATPQT
jgi:hypothetical protein